MSSADDLDRLAALAALGLDSAASPRDIVSAYRRLARSSHPDTAAPSATELNFDQISAAYRFLTRNPGLAAGAAERGVESLAADIKGFDRPGPSTPTPLWADDIPLVAGPVIIRPLPPRSR